MTETFTIRRATDGDFLGIRSVRAATWKSAYRGMMPDEVLDRISAASPPRPIADPQVAASRRSFVAVSRREIVGFSTGGLPRAGLPGYESELWAIYVLPPRQGQGIGKALFAAIRADIALSYRSMMLWVLEANEASHRFYERMGGKRLEFRKPFEWEGRPVAMEVAFGWAAI